MSDPMNWAVRDEPIGSRPAPVTDPSLAYPAPVGAPNPHTGRRLLVPALAGALAVVIVAAGVTIWALTRHTSSPAPAVRASKGAAATFLASGSLLLQDSPGVINLDDVHCRGMRGYNDLGPGAQVVITDEHQTVLGAGQLGVGQLIGSGVTRQCRFDWTVAGVLAGHPLYGVTVSHRGTLQVSESELRGGDLELTIG